MDAVGAGRVGRPRGELLDGAPPAAGGAGRRSTCRRVEQLDTAGAWLLDKLTRELGSGAGRWNGPARVTAHAGAAGRDPQDRSGAAAARRRRSTRVCACSPISGAAPLPPCDEARRLLSFFGQTLIALVAADAAAGPAAPDLADPSPRADLRQRAADRRPDLVPDRHRDGLSGRRPAAALRRRDLHGRSARRSRPCARSAFCSPRSSSPAAPAARSPPRSA